MVSRGSLPFACLMGLLLCGLPAPAMPLRLAAPVSRLSPPANDATRVWKEKNVPMAKLATTSTSDSPITYGNSAYLYDYSGGTSMTGTPAQWMGWVTALAQAKPASATRFSNAFSYGGDMELNPGGKNMFQTFFNDQAQAAVASYAQQGFNVQPIIDGRMDGGQSYSPDLSQLNTSQIQQWADVTAQLYCSNPQVTGITVDLEPYTSKYAAGVNTFLTRLSSNLRGADMNCVTPRYPNGRQISFFTFAANVTPDLVTALGSNGYIVVSGYDLSPAPAGTPSSITTYTNAFKTMIQNIASFPSGTKFAVAIPAAASAHEFEVFHHQNGTVINGNPMYSNNSSTPGYVNVAVSLLQQAIPSWGSNYVGTCLWGFSSKMSYPTHSNNFFTPSMPFAHPGELDFIADAFANKLPLAHV